jgi:arylsulfatase A-like enzyme
LLGFKFDAWEGGHRVPYLARWPGRIPAGSVSDQLICHIDLLATFAALTEQELPADAGPDSRNVLPALVGDQPEPVREQLVLVPSTRNMFALRSGRWLFINAQGGGGFKKSTPGEHAFGGPAALQFAGERNSDVADGRFKPDAPPMQLYDLAADPRQTTNLFRAHPEIVARLQTELRAIQTAPRTRP